MNKDNCILYFTLTPKSESNRKRLSHSRTANYKLIKRMYAHTSRVISDSKIDSFEINEESQCGINFGSRIRHAIEDTFSKGYNNVIVVGNDCLDITKEDLLTAESQLEYNNLTLGKTNSGGAYLFTVSKDNFEAETFENLPWGLSALSSQLCDYLQTSSEVYILDVKSDINSVKQLLNWITNTKIRLSNYFVNILSWVKTRFNAGIRFNILDFVKLQSLRAPPSQF